MIFNVSELIKDVKVALDENASSDALASVGDVDTLSLDEIVGSKIEDAARTVTLHAPSHLLDGGKLFGDVISWEMSVGYGSGRIVLPDDFLRLHSFQMSDWSYPVCDAIYASDPRYAMQKSRYPGVRGCPQKPVVAIVNQPVGLVLEFFSCTQGENVYIKMSRYIPVPKKRMMSDEEVIDLSEKLYNPIVYYAASLVAASIGSSDKSGMLRAACSNLIGIEM